MGAPKGHAPYRGANKGGRPAVDLVELAESIVEWSYGPHALNLIGFTSPRKMSVTKLPEYAKKNKTFREAYKLAKENVSQNRFDAACAEVMPKEFYSRCEGMYDPMYQRYSRREKKFDSELRAKEGGKAKDQQITVKVENGLGSGIDVSAKRLSNPNNKGSK
jgi:hypothetical protein